MARRKIVVPPVAPGPVVDVLLGQSFPAMEIDDVTGIIYVAGTALAGSGGGPNWQTPHDMSGTVDGSNVNFVLPSQPSPNFLITVGGLLLAAGIDYSVADDGVSVTFTQAPTVTPIAYW